jgi:SPP1 gp7 family putative phage head morphogenesis protein
MTQMEEWVEQEHEERIDEEKAFMGALIALYALQIAKEKKLIRNLYEKFAVEGKIPRAELFKYNRAASIKQEFHKIYEQTGVKERKMVTEFIQKDMKQEVVKIESLLKEMGYNVKANGDIDLNELIKVNWIGEVYEDTLTRQKEEQARKAFSKIMLAANKGAELKDTLKEADSNAKSGISSTMMVTQNELTNKKSVVANELFIRYKLEQVQILTAKDERTCSICKPYHGKVFTLGEEPTVPFHSRCRCRVVPYDS